MPCVRRAVAFALWEDFGYLSMVAALEHGLLHCLRFAHAKQQYLIYETDTGRSGVIGCLLLLPIVLPMRFEFFRTKVRESDGPCTIIVLFIKAIVI